MAARASGYERHPDDWYVEERWCVEALANREPFSGSVWDPACGLGQIPQAFRARNLPRVWASDLRDRGCPGSFVHDFLADEPISLHHRAVDNIVMNPPFGRGVLAKAFIEKACTIARAKVAALVDIRFLAGNKRSGRKEMFERLPLSRVWILSDRPSMPPGEYVLRGGAIGSGSTDFCWLIFHHGYDGEPRLGFLTEADAPITEAA